MHNAECRGAPSVSSGALPKTRIAARCPSGVEQPVNDAIDEVAFLHRVGGSWSLLREVAAIFVEDSPGMLEGICDAVTGHDAKALFASAHKLKGSVVNFSARGAAQAALKLERMGVVGELAGAEVAYAELNAEVTRVREALSKLVARGP